MSQTLAVKTTHPAKDFNSIVQIGLKALNLAAAHQAAIDLRLPGTADALGKDVETLSAMIPGATLTRNESGAATVAQNTLLQLGYDRVKAVRKTVRKAGTPRDVQRAYGVGQDTSPSRVRDVKSALQQIVDRALAAPEEAKEFGLVPADVTELKGFISGLAEAEMAQEKKRASAPLSTRARNLTANRVLQAAVLIAGTGMRVFAGKPAEHADFEALMTSTQRPKAKKAKKSAAPKEAAETTVSESPRAEADAKADAEMAAGAKAKREAKADAAMATATDTATATDADVKAPSAEAVAAAG